MNKLVTFVLSFYIALVVYSNAFFIKALTVAKGSDQLFWNKLGILAVIFILVFLLIKKYVQVDRGRSGASTLKLILLVLVTIGLFVAFLHNVVSVGAVYSFPTGLDKFFASPTAFTAWLIAPLLVLFI
jgi:hypothetical protein